MLSYADLPWQKFCELSILTNDLDPVYEGLANVPWSEDKKMRWCAAFMAYYHPGYASEASDLQGDDFWRYLWARIPDQRPAERRHFRGAAAEKAITKWRDMYGTPERFIQECMRPSFMQILNAGVPQIGPYFSWKAADFREAVFGYSMDWSGAEKHLIDLPRQGLALLFPDEKPEKSIWKLVDAISHLAAPPRFSRQCGIAEAETCACMVKSYLNGKLIGADIVEKRDLLTPEFGDNAMDLLQFYPADPQDKDFPL